MKLPPRAPLESSYNEGYNQALADVEALNAHETQVDKRQRFIDDLHALMKTHGVILESYAQYDGDDGYSGEDYVFEADDFSVGMHEIRRP